MVTVFASFLVRSVASAVLSVASASGLGPAERRAAPLSGKPPVEGVWSAPESGSDAVTGSSATEEAPLTLRAAIDRALERNPQLIALRREIEALRERRRQALALPPPSLEAEIWRWPLATLDPRRTDMYMLTVSQPLPRRQKRDLQAQVAQTDIELAEAALAVEIRAVVGEVKRAYAELLLARREVAVHRASVDLLHQLVDVSQVKYASGRISQHDVVKAVLEMSALHNTLAELEARAAVAAARLNTLLDEPPDRPIGDLAEPPARIVLPAVSEIERLALASAPELRRERLAIERVERELSLARAERKPDFVVLGGYFFSPRGEDGWSASLGVTWPRAPWAKAGTEARIAETRSRIDAARAHLRAVENAVRLAVHEAYRRAQVAEARAEVLGTTILPQARQAFEISRVAYQTDRVDFLALIDSERALLDAELDLARALVERDQALADLERLAGVELEEFLRNRLASP